MWEMSFNAVIDVITAAHADSPVPDNDSVVDKLLLRALWSCLALVCLLLDLNV